MYSLLNSAPEQRKETLTMDLGSVFATLKSRVTFSSLIAQSTAKRKKKKKEWEIEEIEEIEERVRNREKEWEIEEREKE